MLYELGRYRDAEPAFELGLNRIEAVVASEKYDAGRQIELGSTLNWLGMTRANLAESASSLTIFRREVAIYEQILRRNPADAAAKNRLAIALQWVGDAECNLGNLAVAIASLDRSLALLRDLRALEPDNTEWQETEVRGRLTEVEFLAFDRRFGEAADLLDGANALLARMIKSDPTNKIWSQELRAEFAKTEIRLALAMGATRQATRAGEEAEKLADLIDDRTEQSSLWHQAGEVQQRLGNGASARALWQRALNALPESPGTDHERYRLLIRLGRDAEAARVAAMLDQRGYRHPVYLRERQR
jgi:tetratricopeptide (TPR) repeat protein